MLGNTRQDPSKNPQGPLGPVPHITPKRLQCAYFMVCPIQYAAHSKQGLHESNEWWRQAALMFCGLSSLLDPSSLRASFALLLDPPLLSPLIPDGVSGMLRPVSHVALCFVGMLLLRARAACFPRSVLSLLLLSQQSPLRLNSPPRKPIRHANLAGMHMPGTCSADVAAPKQAWAGCGCRL